MKVTNMFKFIMTISLVLCFSQIALSQRWISGNWKGKGRETVSRETWSMKLNVQGGKFLVKYPSLRCGGEWKLIKFNNYKASFKENIKFNRKACEPTGNVFIKRLSNKQLLFTYSYNYSPQVAASAILIGTR